MLRREKCSIKEAAAQVIDPPPARLLNTGTNNTLISIEEVLSIEKGSHPVTPRNKYLKDLYLGLKCLKRSLKRVRRSLK
jgi:hypothetical protein